jgi:hypothetical protein
MAATADDGGDGDRMARVIQAVMATSMAKETRLGSCVGYGRPLGVREPRARAKREGATEREN